MTAETFMYFDVLFFFFFQAEDGIRDFGVTGVQTCALPIYRQTSFRAGGGSRSEVSATGDRRKCQTYTASPAEPGGLPVMLEGDRRWSIDFPGRPRWCVISAKEDRVFLAIREPSMVLVAQLPELSAVQQWSLPSGGAHGMDINHGAEILYVACDGGLLVEVDARSGERGRKWSPAGASDATFSNPKSGL